ncbi:PaaI family thioesterase [Allopusillimonas ginsengisoli]|uniref:PaaI family thioesterase n=1 Tax=Allopusillimonas ginsengisoli TaxID=453575 RepID=UPI0010C1FC61|nr:PaaI family thioesterase [Allopusillimonas ginsengisoli]
MDVDFSGWREHTLDGLMGAVGPLLSKRVDGGWQYGLVVSERHLNAAGVVHGGTITTLLDQALSALAWHHAGKTPCVTVQLNSSFLDAARCGELLIATGRVVRATRSMIFMVGEVMVEECTIATCQGIFKIVRES